MKNLVSINGMSTNTLRVPGNATVLDGWLHVTDSPMATSLDTGITWEAADFSSGTFFGTELIDDEIMTLEDDGTRSNISTFDEGEITVNLNSAYKYSPGWRHVYDYGYYNYHAKKSFPLFRMSARAEALSEFEFMLSSNSLNVSAPVLTAAHASRDIQRIRINMHSDSLNVSARVLFSDDLLSMHF